MVGYLSVQHTDFYLFSFDQSNTEVRKVCGQKAGKASIPGDDVVVALPQEPNSDIITLLTMGFRCWHRAINLLSHTLHIIISLTHYFDK